MFSRTMPDGMERADWRVALLFASSTDDLWYYNEYHV